MVTNLCRQVCRHERSHCTFALSDKTVEDAAECEFTCVIKKKKKSRGGGGVKVSSVVFFPLQPDTLFATFTKKFNRNVNSRGRERLLKDHRVGKCVGVSFCSSLFQPLSFSLSLLHRCWPNRFKWAVKTFFLFSFIVMLKVWTRTVLFIQRVLHLHNCTCTCLTSHQSVPVSFSAVKRVVFRQHKPFIYTCCVIWCFVFLGSECFFLKLWTQVRKFVSAWFFFF